MKTCRTSSALIFGILLGMAVPALVAQSAAGLRPFGSYGAGNLDSVNLTDLDLHIHVPIIDNPGRGLPFTYSLDYDGLLWQPVLVNGQEVWSPPAGAWGWAATTSGNAGSYSFLDTQEQCRDQHGNIYYYDLYRYFTYTDSSGVTHSFSGSTGGRPQECGGNGGSSAFTSIASDGSGYTMHVTNQANAVLTSSSGETLNAEGPQGLPALGPVVDRNGNEITQSVSGSTITYADTVGNQIIATTANGFISSVKYPGPNGYPQTVTVQFQPMQISTQNLYCASGGPVGGYGPVTVELPFHFIFPNGEEYSVSYNSDGAMNALTLPSGGIIQYTYNPNGPGGQDYINCATGEWADLNRTTPQTANTPSTEWSYALAPGSVSGQMVTTITNGAQQAKTVLTSMGGYETERDIYSTASGAEIRSILTCYNGNTVNCSSSPVAAAVIQRDVFTTLGAAGSGALTSETMTGYDALGNETERDDYAFGAGAPGALLRRVLTTMDTSLGSVEDEPSAIAIDSGAGTPIVAETTFSYDQTALAATSGVPNHIAVSGPRGNLTDVEEYTAAGAYLTRYFTYFDTGLVHQDFAENNGQTTFAYGECGGSLPTLITKPDSTTESIGWDCSGQRPVSITDANGQATSYQYDDLGAGGWQWRPTTITGPDGTTNITYYATETDSSHDFGGSTDTTIVCFDQLGRPLLRQREWGPGVNDYDTVQTSYDGIGRAIAITAPEASSRCTAPSNPVTAKSIVYDALDRPTSITDANGAAESYTYNGNDVLQVLGPAPTGESTKQRQLEYDALGRLSSVCEVTGAADGVACGQTAAANGYLTTYSYDPAGRQTGAIERDNAATQTRSAVFDWLGRKTSETGPESGTTNYVYDLDAGVCPGETGNDMGSVVEKSDADGSVTCFYHDSSARLIEESYSLANTPTRYFVYGAGVSVDGQPMQYAAGRMAEAFTGSPTSKQTDEGFSYAADGNLATLYEKTPNESAYSDVTDTYAQNGTVSGVSSSLAGLPTFTYGLDGEGRWYSVSASSGQNPVSQSQYNAGSETTQVWYGSGDHDSFSYDSALENMTEFDNSVGAGAEYGVLTWNPNGTLAGLRTGGSLAAGTNCSYMHDDLARLQSVTCDPWTQTFTVDAFGNIAVNSAGAAPRSTRRTTTTPRTASAT